MVEQQDPSKKEQRPVMKKMTGALLRNVNAMGALTTGISSLHSAHANLTKTLISTGRMQLGSLSQLHKTFDNRGLSLTDSIALNSSILESGLATYGKNTEALNKSNSGFSTQKKMLSEYANVGKSTKNLSSMMVMNQQALGMSNETTAKLVQHTIQLGATYGFNSDKIVEAVNKLSGTWTTSMGTFGPDVAAASQKAMATLMGEFGVGAEQNIQSLIKTLSSGTKESAITAQRLGIDMAKLTSTNSEDQVSALKQGLSELKKIIGTGTGADRALWVQPLLDKLGGTPGMLALTRMEPISKELKDITLAEQAEQARRADVMASMNDAVKNITLALAPAIEVVAGTLNVIAKVLNALKFQVAAIVLIMAARAATTAIKQGHQNLTGKFKASAAKVADPTMTTKAGQLRNSAGKFVSNKPLSLSTKTTNVIGKGFGAATKMGTKLMGGMFGKIIGGTFRMLLGPWGILLSFIPTILDMFGISLFSDEEAEKDRKKTNELLTKPNKQEMHLASIAASIGQSNLFQQQMLLEAAETTKAIKEGNEKTEPIPAPTGNQFSIPSNRRFAY